MDSQPPLKEPKAFEDTSTNDEQGDRKKSIQNDRKFDAVENEEGAATKSSVFKRLKDWLVADKSRLGSLIFLVLFFVLIIVLASLNLNFGSIMQSIVDWFEVKIGLIGIYIGVFVISIFGNFTVIFPIPYTLALITVAVRPSINALEIFILGLFAGAGAAIGETSAWLLGKASKNVMEDSMEKQVSRAKKWIDKGLAPLIIFLFAATPLPDDAVLVFIGLLAYPLWKTLIWCILGKIVLTSLTGYAAKYFAYTTFGSKLLWLFGLTVEDGSIGASEPSPWISALVWVVTIVLIGVFLFIDWGNLWNHLSRSFYKKKLLQLVSDEQKQEGLLVSTNTRGDSSKKGLTKKKTALNKDDFLWQCVLTKKEGAEFPEYHDLYELPYITTSGALEPNLSPDWIEELNTLIKRSKNKIHMQTLSKIKLPKKMKELLTNEQQPNVEELLIKRSLFIKMNYQKKDSKAKYNLQFLLEHSPSTNELKVVCLGEKEALTIRQIKKYDRKVIVGALVELLKSLPAEGENYSQIIVGVSEQSASFFHAAELQE